MELAIAAVVTADRPGHLEATLASLIRHCHRFGRRPHLLVVDGSRGADAAATNRRTTDRVRNSSYPHISLIGRQESARLRRHLYSCCPQAVVDFGLTAGDAGANRNIALAIGSGQPMMLMDDDVLCETWAPSQFTDVTRLIGHADERAHAVFKTRHDAIRSVCVSHPDLLGAHGRMLGRSLKDIMTSPYTTGTWNEPCGHMRMAIANDIEAIVRLTFAGVAGDSGVSCPYRLLFGTGTTKSMIWGSADAMQMSLSYRETSRIATAFLVTHNASCMGYCFGVISTASTPPFFPFGRNQDGLFGATQQWLDPLALYAHLPVGVLHLSGREPTYSSRHIESASGTRMSDLVMSLLRGSTIGLKPAATTQRTALVATALLDACGASPREFQERSVKDVRSSRLTQIAELDRAMLDGDTPAYVRDEYEKYIKSLTAAMATSTFSLPLADEDEPSGGSAWARTRELVQRFAQLIQQWPIILNHLHGSAPMDYCCPSE